MKIAIKNRLSFRLTRNTVTLALILGMMMSFIQVVLDFLDEESSLDNEIKAIIAISHAPASQIAYNIDARLANELLEGLLKHPAIIHAEIIDTDQRVLSIQDRPKAESPYRWLSDLLFLPTKYYTEELHVPQLTGYILGNLNVTADTYPRGSQFLQRSTFTILAGFIRSLILSVVLLILFYLMLTEPLVKVISAVSEVNPETPEKVRLPVPHGHEQDEIGVLVNSTNNHLHALDGNLEKLRKAESRLKTYSEQLELIVESRTNELSRKNIQLIKGNHDLRVAKEEALQKAKARADFLANMSHEIRTPFNGVLGMIGLTLEEPLSEKQKEQLNVAYSSGVALLELLNDILDISKVEAGKLTLENISFNLRKVVEDVTRLLAQNAHAKSVELHSLVAADFPERVYGDPTRIRQIISNLVGNAIKFTEQGAVSIHLSAPANQGIELAVTDTGIGIDDSQIDAVFSPFSQGDKQTTRKFGGTGLGLTLCKQLVNHMDGQLTVESSPGKGSSFKVVLPLLTDRQVKPPIIDPRLHDCHYVLIHRQTNETFTSIGAEFKQWKLHYQALSYQQIQDLDLKHYPFQTDTMVLFDSRSLAPALVELACINQLTLILVARLSIFCEKSVLQSMKIKELVSAPLSRSRLRDTLYKAIGIYGKAAPSQDQLPELTAKSGKHILLVEDNKVNQLVAKTILAKLGYRVTIANDGKEAIERISHEDFSIVLMDCHMPVLDGYEATREIRKQERFQHLPIIAVTANVMEGDREKCMACGMNDYLSKPYDKKVLTDKLAKWLA